MWRNRCILHCIWWWTGLLQCQKKKNVKQEFIDVKRFSFSDEKNGKNRDFDIYIKYEFDKKYILTCEVIKNGNNKKTFISTSSVPLNQNYLEMIRRYEKKVGNELINQEDIMKLTNYKPGTTIVASGYEHAA